VETNVVSDDEDIGEFVGHSGVVDGHEGRVDDDAHGDEEVDECVHDEQLHDASERLPTWRTMPVNMADNASRRSTPNTCASRSPSATAPRRSAGNLHTTFVSE